MISRLRSDTEAWLREALSDEPELHDFATAVVAHLTGGGGDDWDEPTTAARVLEAIGQPGTNEGDGFPFHQHPELLASFFQNADLLDPDSDSTSRIAKAVLLGLQLLEGSE